MPYVRIYKLQAKLQNTLSIKEIKAFFRKLNAETVGIPGGFPAKIASKIMGSQELKNEWVAELQEVTGRILNVRSLLLEKLNGLKTPGYWGHIVNQCGLFSYIGLGGKLIHNYTNIAEKCEELIMKKHTYLLKSGRMCVAGLNTHNVGFVARALNEVLTQKNH